MDWVYMLECGDGLGLVLGGLQLVDDDDVAALGLAAQSRQQRQTLDLLVQAIAVIAGLGAQRYTAMRPLRAAGRALARTAGALLAPRLAAAAGHFAARLGALRALTLIGEEIHNSRVHNFFIGSDAKDGVGKLNRGYLLAVHI